MKLLTVLFLLALLVSCGVQDLESPTTGGNVSDTAFSGTVKPILQKNCAGTGCHVASGEEWFSSGDALKASDVKKRLDSKSMPIPGSPQSKTFTEADKTAILKYISGT